MVEWVTRLGVRLARVSYPAGGTGQEVEDRGDSRLLWCGIISISAHLLASRLSSCAEVLTGVIEIERSSHGGVEAVWYQSELLRGSLLYELALVEDQDQIRVCYSAYSVRDDDHSGVFERFA